MQAASFFPTENHDVSWKRQIFDRLNDKLDQMLEQGPMKSIDEITGAIFRNRSEILGDLALGFIDRNHKELLTQEHADCPICGKTVHVWNKSVKRNIESMGGSFVLYRPYFYCRKCRHGFYPLDEALGLAPSAKQYDIQDVEVWLSTELPFETAAEAFNKCTGSTVSADHMFETTNRIAGSFDILGACPTKEEIESQIDELSEGKFRRPVMMMAIDGAHGPTRPEPSPWKGPRGKGEWKEAKGFRLYLVDADRIIHLISWHQIQDEEQFAQCLYMIKEAGLIPEDKVRLCIIGDGAPWIWNKPLQVFPNAKQVLDFYHCSGYIHAVANAQYGKASRKACEWVEATFVRLFHNAVDDVIRGLKIMVPATPAAQDAIEGAISYLSNHRERVNYGAAKRASYHLGSGAIESANKFIGHVRLKRSGAWWYKTNANNILKLRCAKYNGTYDRIIQRYKELDRAGELTA